jgi:protein-tyrosine-phosphatase
MDDVDCAPTRHRHHHDRGRPKFVRASTLAPEAHHKALDLTRTFALDVEYWPTADPTIAEGNREQRLDAYREVRDHLMRRIRQRFGAPPPGTNSV